MTNQESIQEFSKHIYNLVRAYVYQKTEAKSGIRWDDFKNNKVKDPTTGKEKIAYPQKYVETLQKICTDAFLRFRSCKSREDFVSYFTATICSVPQFLPADQFEKVALLLLQEEKWSEAKAISMLALSALSRV